MKTVGIVVAVCGGLVVLGGLLPLFFDSEYWDAAVVVFIGIVLLLVGAGLIESVVLNG